jgi:hypothetical protein
VTSVTIASGTSSANFYFGDTNAGSPVITASGSGLTSVMQTETIGSDQLVITSSPVSGTATISPTLGPITVQLQDASGTPINTGITVDLLSDSTGVNEFSASSGGSPVTSVTISPGSSTAEFYYGDEQAATPTITASAAGVTAGAAHLLMHQLPAAECDNASVTAKQPSKKTTARPVAQADADPPVAGSDGRARVGVRKTYKLYVGGGFPRSESGRTYLVRGADGAVLANAALASRKDARDAVVAGRAAVDKWAGATAYNRGQVLYRVAELMQGRAGQFAEEIVNAEGFSRAVAERTVEAVIDRWVWYAGWPDKVAQVVGGANAVAGPYFNFSVPEPTGVVAVVAPQGSSLLGLVSVVAPVIATGNTVVVIASEDRPLPAVTLSEVLATSDVPGGVVNILTGRTAELAPVLAAHFDVNAIDLTGAAAGARAELERAAASSVKRVFCAEDDWAAVPTPRRMLAFLEIKTVWHPVGI